MKQLIYTVLFGILILPASYGQQDFRLFKSAVKLNGTSTLHSWSCEAKQVSGQFSLTEANGKLTDFVKFYLEIETNSIKSNKGSMMDNNLYTALKAKDFPKIKVTEKQVKRITLHGTSYTVLILCNLEIAGQSREIELQVEGQKLANGMYEFSGNTTIQMTNWNIQPPTFMAGTMKTGDHVRIDFSVTLARPSAESGK